MHYDKIFMIAIVIFFWLFFPKKNAVRIKKEKKPEQFSTDWSNTFYGAYPWNGWPY